MQVAGDDDDKTIVEKVNKTLGIIKADFETLANMINTANSTTLAPGSTTKKPVTSTGTPVTTPKQPATTTNNPATTKTAATTTKKPATTTKKPATTTKAAATTTKAAATTTKAAATTSKKPSSSSKQPPPSGNRKKRDVLSQIWEMKMRKMQNKLATVAPPAGVATLTAAMKKVTAVTDEIADGTIQQDQVTRVEVAEKNIKAVVTAADANVISYMKKNPDILEGLQKEAAAASKTVKKYYDDHFEDDGGANVGAIVGGVCGGVAGVGLLGFGYYYYKKKQS